MAMQHSPTHLFHLCGLELRQFWSDFAIPAVRRPHRLYQLSGRLAYAHHYFVRREVDERERDEREHDGEHDLRPDEEVVNAALPDRDRDYD